MDRLDHGPAWSAHMVGSDLVAIRNTGHNSASLVCCLRYFSVHFWRDGRWRLTFVEALRLESVNCLILFSGCTDVLGFSNQILNSYVRFLSLSNNHRLSFNFIDSQ